MMKAGIFSSLDRFQSEGELAVKRYYQHHLGEDGAEDIFYT